MAIQTRFYVEKGPSNTELQMYVGASVSAVERYRSPVCLLQYDDVTPGIMEALDEYMDSLGYDNLVTNLVTDVFARGTNPAAVPGRVLVYAKTVSGITQLYARADDGTVTQLTPKQLPVEYINGLVPAYTSASTVTIGVGEARDKSDNMNLKLAAPVVVDITVSGVNGLDTGAEAGNNWYYIYVIGDSTGVLPTAGILSANQNAPTYPAGYDISRRVGSVRNNGGNFRDFQVFGGGATRSVQYRDALSTRQRLTSGNATVFTAVALSAVVPQTSQLPRLQYQQRGTTDGLIYDDPTQLLANPQRTLLSGATVCDLVRCPASRDIAYAHTVAGGLLDIWVTGYDETV